MNRDRRASLLSRVGRVDYLSLVTSSALKVWVYLAGLPDGAKALTSEEIGAQVGLSRNTIDRARRELDAIGWIAVSWEEPSAGRFSRWRASLLIPPVELRRAATKYYAALLGASMRTILRKQALLRQATRSSRKGVS